MCEYCTCYCCESEEERIDRIVGYWRRAYVRFICRKEGHQFKDDSTYKEYNFIVQICERCGKYNLIHYDDRKQCSEEESANGYGLLVYHYINIEADLFKLLPKKPWSRNK